MKSKKILLIGKIPPPLGGVTIHVDRLLKELQQNNINHSFITISATNLLPIISNIAKHQIIHLHTSNSYVRLILLLWMRIMKKKSIFTFHGNVYRYDRLRNFADLLSITIADYPILINEKSYVIASRINKRAKLISAFIPPHKIDHLDGKVVKEIVSLKNKYPIIFCTNASRVAYDNKGREVYQISSLIEVFSQNNYLLIISDPSGNYKKKILRDSINVTDNVFWINFPHDFNAVLQIADCLIRYTTTDGDSLSVKDALLLGKNVIASDIVDRPVGVTLTPLSLVELGRKIKDFKPEKVKHNLENGFDKIFQLYMELIYESNHSRP